MRDQYLSITEVLTEILRWLEINTLELRAERIREEIRRFTAVNADQCERCAADTEKLAQMRRALNTVIARIQDRYRK